MAISLRHSFAYRYQEIFFFWQTVYTYFRNWRQDGTWLKIHDSLREWVRLSINVTQAHPRQ
jgi:transposase